MLITLRAYRVKVKKTQTGRRGGGGYSGKFWVGVLPGFWNSWLLLDYVKLQHTCTSPFFTRHQKSLCFLN